MTENTDSPFAKNRFNRNLRKPAKVLGVEFAPILIPLERRKQVLGILACVMVVSVVPFGTLFFLALLYSNYYPLALLYLVWAVYDRNTRNKGGRRKEWFRRWSLWKSAKDYFPLKLIKTVDLDPKRNYLFGVHPHGIFCIGALMSFATEALDFSNIFPNMTSHLLTVDTNLLFPFTREFFLAIGACPATKKSMNYLLSDPKGGRVGILLPGGVPEQLESHPGTNLIKLKDRKGFVKLAIQNGSPLVPVYCFGETDAYMQWSTPLLRKFQLACIRVLGFYPPLINGRGMLQYSFGFLPQRVPITTVVGAPIEVEKTRHPTQEQIDSLHGKFVSALKDLFYTHREECGYPYAEIRIC